ncbi:periplasmic chaperone for outer membrane proteins Skp [Lutibacter agarilyticus]|uniref:Periplasmic chaperone for outer membrane proteins Skp n=1 Tax=Lutibacter agarilyticus TaxID=1109740 RepID=A0A238W329_9FLAO|nr:OmpH family outer membrane protein [Lutibacter agarilyticus]SNR40936.1 periplasmic chaperone for outer membrane proteins Skp [Lutibacter agarilyticus]
MKKLLLVVVAIVLVSCSQTKIAYIDVADVMSEYKAMIALETEMTAKQQQVAGQLQASQAAFQTKVQEYYKNAPSMSASKKQTTEQALQQEGQQLQGQQQQASQMLEQENITKSEVLIKTIDSIVADYSKSKGFGIVLGTQGNGTVMYGDDALNITSDVVAILNADFDAAEEVAAEVVEETPAE